MIEKYVFGEPFMLEDRLTSSQSVVRVLFKELFDQILELVRKDKVVMMWESDLVFENVAGGDLAVAVVESGFAARHIVHDNSHGPPVNSSIVAAFQRLWCHELRRAAL